MSVPIFLAVNGFKFEFSVFSLVVAAIYTANTDAVLIGVNINSSKPVEKTSRGAMTVYFASKDENIWNIAKKYCASVKEIMRINELTEEIIENDRMILVPMI